jgi:hypothetical protein
MPLEELMKTVATHFEVEESDLKSPSKKKQVVEAKSAFGYLAIKKMGYSGREVGSFLNMRSYSAIRRAQEGKKLIDNRGDMSEISVPHYTENSGIVATSPITHIGALWRYHLRQEPDEAIPHVRICAGGAG